MAGDEVAGLPEQTGSSAPSQRSKSMVVAIAIVVPVIVMVPVAVAAPLVAMRVIPGMVIGPALFPFLAHLRLGFFSLSAVLAMVANLVAIVQPGYSVLENSFDLLPVLASIWISD